MRWTLILPCFASGFVALTTRRTSIAHYAKDDLMSAIDEFRALKERDGGVSVDFGERGGELDENRAPSNLVSSGKYYDVSEELGKAADRVVEEVGRLEEEASPLDPTKFFGTAEGAKNGLHGGWAQLFTTAADATFDKKSKRGDADVCNVVDSRKAEISNIIRFKKEDSKVDELKVRLTCKATSKNRIELIFRSVRIRFKKRFLGVIKQIVLPVPAIAISRILNFIRRKKKPDLPYFDILYLDDQIRVQRTGDGNVFVQTRIDAAKVGF